jgi:hypothetical protein
MKEKKRSGEFDKMIIEAVQRNLVFYAWHSLGGSVEKCELKIKAFRKDYNEIELEVGHEEGNMLSRIISGNRILNIYVPELSISFFSELKSLTLDNKVKIYPPSEYSFYERRKHERVEPLKNCFVSFEHNKQIIKKTIFDFSLGGIAIILPKSDKLAIAKGKLFSDFIIEIGMKKIKTKVECINSFSIDRFKFDKLPYGGYKLAFRFVEMSKADKAFLVDFMTQLTLTNQAQKKAN